MRRGRLDTARAYRLRMDDLRIFNQRKQEPSRIKSFAFSLMVDISASMGGQPIVSATRALVLLSEVCREMKIPFEVMTFENHPQTIKKFNEEMTSKMEARIGGVAKADGGGTWLLPCLEASEIRQRPESRKIAIILSDGWVGDHGQHQTYFDEWRKDNVQELGVGINCGDDIVQLCRGNGVSTDTPQQLPQIFEEMLQKLILHK